MTYLELLPAYIALLLSLTLAVIEIRRHFHGLRLNITGVNVIDGRDSMLYLLLHLTVVNPSTITRTIYQIEFQPLESFQISEVPGVQDFAQALVTFQPLGIDGRGIQVRLNDTASWPLDIEPLHSKTVFLCIALFPVSLSQPVALQTPSWKIFGYLLASDYRKKQIAKVALEGPL